MTRRSRWPSGVAAFRDVDGNTWAGVDCGVDLHGPFVTVIRADVSWTAMASEKVLKPLNADARIMLEIARAK